MTFSGIAADSQILLHDSSLVNASECTDQLVHVPYSNVDGLAESVYEKKIAQLREVKTKNLYKLELTNDFEIEAMSSCKFLCEYNGELKWFELFDIPSEALIVTIDGNHQGRILLRREGPAASIEVKDYNAFVANGFVVSTC